MDFIARGLEAVPILLTQYLARDEEQWTVELHRPSEDEPSEETLIVSGHLVEVTWEEVVVQPVNESDEEEGTPVTIDWDDVGTVVVP